VKFNESSADRRAAPVRTESGLKLQVRAPNRGVVFQDAATQTCDENNELLSHCERCDEGFFETICPVLLAL
jgi:hypothetical protein